MNSVTLSKQYGDRTVTLTYADETANPVDLARQAEMAMKWLAVANTPKPAGWPRLSDEVRTQRIEAHDHEVWECAPCANLDPEERVA